MDFNKQSTITFVTEGESLIVANVLSLDLVAENPCEEKLEAAINATDKETLGELIASKNIRPTFINHIAEMYGWSIIHCTANHLFKAIKISHPALENTIFVVKEAPTEVFQSHPPSQTIAFVSGALPLYRSVVITEEKHYQAI